MQPPCASVLKITGSHLQNRFEPYVCVNRFPKSNSKQEGDVQGLLMFFTLKGQLRNYRNSTGLGAEAAAFSSWETLVSLGCIVVLC